MKHSYPLRPSPRAFFARVAVISALAGTALVAPDLGAQVRPGSVSPRDSAVRHDLVRDSTARDSVQRLELRTITATRASSSTLTTPLAITRIARPELRAISGFGLDEALAQVPGVIARSRFGTSDVQLMIRGFGARGAGDRSNSGTSRGVRVLIDGLPETEPDGRTALDNVDLATAEAMEVVRSNASAEWGNASGGVVNVLTAPLGARTPVIELQPMTGSFGLQRYALRASTPVHGGVAYVNFTNSTFDGWRAHSSARRTLLNAGVVGQLGDATRIGMYLSAANNLMHVPGPLTQAQVNANPRQANATYLARDERRYNRAGRLGVTIDQAITPSFSLSSMVYVNPKYLQRSERNTYRDFTRYHFGGNVIARKSLVMGEMASRVMVGVDEAYQDGAILFYTLSATGGRGPTLTDNKGEGAQNLGLFVQNELAVNARLTLLLGARLDRVSYNYRSYLAAPPVRSDSRDFSRVSPKLGASWLLNDSHSVYANVGGGIEVPAGNETDPTPGAPPALLNPLLDPITSTTYEVGLKRENARVNHAGFAFNYDLALYDLEVTNEIIPYNGGRYYLTAGRGRRQGAELGMGARTRQGAFLNAALTGSRNRYLHYVVDSAVIFPTDPTKAGKRANYSGNKVVGVPNVVANIEVGTSVPGYRALRVKGGVEHSGEYFADDANSVRVKAYTLLNFTAELRDPILASNGWGLRGFLSVRNVANRAFIGASFLNPDIVSGAAAAYEPGMPRTVTVSISLGRLR
jgi:iron complex outermembrane receptor protein